MTILLFKVPGDWSGREAWPCRYFSNKIRPIAEKTQYQLNCEEPWKWPHFLCLTPFVRLGEVPQTKLLLKIMCLTSFLLSVVSVLFLCKCRINNFPSFWNVMLSFTLISVIWKLFSIKFVLIYVAFISHTLIPWRINFQ